MSEPQSLEEHDNIQAGLAAEAEANAGQQAEADAAAVEAEIEAEAEEHRRVTGGHEPMTKEDVIIEMIKEQAFQAGYQKCKDELATRAFTVHDLIRDAYEEGKSDTETETVSTLLKLPETIRGQSKGVAFLTNQIEKLRLTIDRAKMQALDTVCCVTEQGKPKYINKEARSAAQEQLLRESRPYLDNCDTLGRLEMQLRDAQIELDYQHNLFRAHLAVAGIKGVR